MTTLDRTEITDGFLAELDNFGELHRAARPRGARLAEPLRRLDRRRRRRPHGRPDHRRRGGPARRPRQPRGHRARGEGARRPLGQGAGRRAVARTCPLRRDAPAVRRRRLERAGRARTTRARWPTGSSPSGTTATSTPTTSDPRSGCPRRGAPGCAASVHHVADFLQESAWGPATLALDGVEVIDVRGGGKKVTGDPVEFVLAATGRADPSPLGLDESVNIYG